MFARPFLATVNEVIEATMSAQSGLEIPDLAAPD
jgi:hypothetical protein